MAPTKDGDDTLSSNLVDHGDHHHVVGGLPGSNDEEQTKTVPKKSNDDRVPVTILTGFLGAGKTTLLNNLLKDPTHGYKFAIIENELGAVGIDNELLKNSSSPKVEKVEEEMIEVVNGCICCTVRGDLMEALERLHQNYLTQKVSRRKGRRRSVAFDAVIIETTGLADPAPVVQTFFIERSMQQKFRLDSVLTVVDSKQVLTRLDEEKPEGVANEAVQQVLFADKIFLNKMDLVTAEEIQAVESRLKTLHPTAPLIHCTEGKVPPSELVGLESFNLDRVCDMVPDFLDDEFLEFNEKHDTAVSSVACTVDGELMVGALSDWISQKLIGEMGGERLYRYKGVLAVKGKDAKYIFQGVGMLFNGDFSKELKWQPNEKRASRFVFIGKDLDHQMLKEGFENCRAPEKLRFQLGEEVEANVGTWARGIIIALWDEGNAYRIQLKDDEDREIWAAVDTDELVRKKQEQPQYHFL